jgi:hypothetical protein
MLSLKNFFTFMVSTFNECASQPETDRPETDRLETCIRTVLEQRELLPGMATQFQSWKTLQHLSNREQRLLEILQDAIDAGYVRQI